MPDKKILLEGIMKLAFKYKYFLIIIIVGLAFLLIPGNSKNKATDTSTFNQSDFSVEKYEKRIEETLGKCHGVGRVSVMLAIKSGIETVYAEEERITTREQSGNDITDYNKDFDRRPSILSDGSGKEVPVTIKQINPEFLGATVICDGADNPKVRLYVTEAVSSLTGITSDRITVIKMKT